jgi:hypothetical protein
LSFAHVNSNTYGHGHTDSDGNRDGYSDYDSYAESDSHIYSKVSSDASASPNPAASPVATVISDCRLAQIADSSSTKAASFSFARTTNRFPSFALCNHQLQPGL